VGSGHPEDLESHPVGCCREAQIEGHEPDAGRAFLDHHERGREVKGVCGRERVDLEEPAGARSNGVPGRDLAPCLLERVETPPGVGEARLGQRSLAALAGQRGDHLRRGQGPDQQHGILAEPGPAA